MSTEMTSLQRVLTTLGHQEPDRVPLFLLLTMHGARELGMSIREYFSKAEHVVAGQLKLRKKYRNDCIYSFFYAPVEGYFRIIMFNHQNSTRSHGKFNYPFIRLVDLINNGCGLPCDSSKS